MEGKRGKMRERFARRMRELDLESVDALYGIGAIVASVAFGALSYLFLVLFAGCVCSVA